MAIPINHSALPSEVQNAVEVIYAFLEKSGWKEMHVALLHTLTGVPKSGDTPSPPPAQEETEQDSAAEIKNKRKAAASARRNAEKRKPKCVAKTPEEIGAALQQAKETPPGAAKNLARTLLEYFGEAADANPEERIWRNHLFGHKIRQEEASLPGGTTAGRSYVVGEQFRRETPQLSEKHRKEYLRMARKIYDATAALTPAQVLQIQGITCWDLARLSQRNVQKLRQMYE